MHLRAPWIAVLIAVSLTGCSGKDSSGPTATPSPSIETATATSAPPSPSVSATPGEPRVQITGMFRGEPPAGSQPAPLTRSLAPRPESAFAPWDGTTSVIYDTATNRQFDIGYASLVVFSPDSARAAWIAGASTAAATVMNLATGEVRTYAEGTNVGFLDERRLAVYQASTSTWKVFDLDTGQLSADQSLRSGQAQPGFPSYPPSPAGYYWQFVPDPSTALPRGWAGKNDFRLIEIATGETALRFDAVFAALAGPGEIVVATPLEGVMTNIFVVNVQSGRAEFISRTRYGQGPNWPLSATARYVLWTDNFCYSEGIDQQGRVQLFDRAARTQTDVDDGTPPAADRYARLTPGNLIAWGSFGASALIDPVSLAFATVLPEPSPPNRLWSPDFRYASYGLVGGHGGLC